MFIIVAKPKKSCGGITKKREAELEASCETKKVKDGQPDECAAASTNRIGNTATVGSWP